MTLRYNTPSQALRTLVFATSLAVGPTASFAHIERLDDSASPRSQVTAPPMLSEQGQPLDRYIAGPAPTVGIVKFGRVEYKLATARFVGKQARIFYVIPPAIVGLRSPAGMRVEWRGSGLFADGVARPGQRTLVWSGPVRDTFMSEGLDLTLRIDLRELQLRPGAGLAFESFFEIEVSP